MDVYLRNYWSLHLEFIKVFSNITYRNIPLPLLSNFYQYLDGPLQRKMEANGFSAQPLKEEEIQPRFDKWLRPLRKPIQAKAKQGKLLMNFDYLRFTNENYQSFSPAQTLILTRGRGESIHGIPVISQLDYIDNNHPKVAHNFTQKAESIFKIQRLHPAFSNPTFQQAFLKDIPKMIEKIDMVHSILKKHPIQAILVGTTEELTSRVLTIIGQIFGIPSFCLQHGLILGEEAYLPAFASHYIVYGNYEKEWYQKRGVPAEQIAMLGHPRFDTIFTSPPINRQQVLQQLRLDPRKKTILLATQPNNDTLFTEIINLTIQHPNLQIIIKPHPWEKAKKRTKNYETLARKYQQVHYITAELPLYQLISISDVVVVANSTVGLEAMLMNKPVLILKSPTANRDYPYYDTLNTLVKTTPIEIQEAITALITSSSQKKEAEHNRNQFLQKNYPTKNSINALQNLISKYISINKEV